MITPTRQFRGPLFIIGMPRSGTKLLRDLLNQNPRIAIPVIESHFIPGFIKKYGSKPSGGTPQELELFYKDFLKTSFYWHMANRGMPLTFDEFRKMAQTGSWNDRLSGIFRFYARKNHADQNIIWGDKTPGYQISIPLLKQAFPDAKFVHIIRDPRDYALSVQKAWGRSLNRAATLWRDQIQKSRRDSQRLGGDYKEIFYEKLLSAPEDVLKDLCMFLGCSYSKEMLELKGDTEELGSAKEAKTIVRSNTNKYHKGLSKEQIKAIEEIVFPLAQDLRYEINYGKDFKPLSRWRLKFLVIYDGAKSMLFHIKQKGPLKGMIYFCGLHLERRTH